MKRKQSSMIVVFICAVLIACMGPFVAFAENPTFITPDKTLWQTPSPNVYRASGKPDTFAWSEEIVEGDMVLQVDIDSRAPDGEGVVVIYGNGVGWSKGCLIFNLADKFQCIRAHTIYQGVQFLASAKFPMDFQNRSHRMTVEINGGRASLYADGQRRLSAFLPPDMERRGRIGLFKFWERPGVTYSNIVLKHPQQAAAAPKSQNLSALHGHKIALIIGNDAYGEAPLRNPVNDAEDMAAALRLLGFEIIQRTNANQREMEDAVNEFFGR